MIETAAEMSGWFAHRRGRRPRQGFGFARYKNRAAYVAVVAEVEVDEEVRVTRVWGAVDAGLVINPDGAANQIEGGIIQAVELDAEGAGALRRTAASPRSPGRTIRS